LQARLAKSAVAAPKVATDSLAFSLRFNAKSGIVEALMRRSGSHSRLIAIFALKSWS